MRHLVNAFYMLAVSISSFAASPFIGELSFSTHAIGTDPSDVQIVTRYLPAFEIQNSLSDSWDYDIELRWQLAWDSTVDIIEFTESNTIFEPYRVALNLQSKHTEYVIGLQKINFGPAKILRPLMWFDAVNPTDPLELTSGVTGISANYYYEFGWSSQAWLLLPGDPMGWEVFAGKSNTIETGGRLTIPNNRGQIGLSSHFRIADISEHYPDDPDLYEGRIGLDGFWDVGVGLWIESVYKHQELSTDPFLDQIQATIGSDYTIWIGNGIHIMAEHMVISSWNSPFMEDQTSHLSTAMFSFSPTMFDQVSLLVVNNWETETPLAYLSWGQTYDNFRFTLAAFYSKLADTSDANPSSSSSFNGKGIELTVAFNH